MCSAQIGDRGGELTARMNVSDLQLVLGLKQNNSNTNSSVFIESPPGDSSLPGNSTHNFPQTIKPQMAVEFEFVQECTKFGYTLFHVVLVTV